MSQALPTRATSSSRKSLRTRSCRTSRMANSSTAYLPFAFAMCLGACSTNTTSNVHPEVHGHRGCRGLMPENTIPAFLAAAEMGCEWIELDVVITGDGHVLVSHEPWMEHRICRTPERDSIPQPHEP